MVDTQNNQHQPKMLSLESKVSREDITCDGPGCDKMDPSNRCSRCHCRYYCSADCQKNDWTRGTHKSHCCPVKLKIKEEALPNGIVWRTILNGSKMFNVEEEDLDNAIQAVIDCSNSSINADCSICMNDPIENPVVLDGCNHGFCAPCLLKWQEEQQSFKRYEAKGSNASLTCPLCGQTARDVNDLVSYRAGMYQAKARCCGDKERTQFLELAIQEINKALAFDQGDSTPDVMVYFMKAELLVEIGRGQEALDCIHQTMRISEAKMEATHHLKEQMEAARAEGSLERMLQLMEELKSMPIGAYSGLEMCPRAKTGIEVQRGGAYRCIGDYDKAAKCYKSALPLFSSLKVTTIQKRKVYEGLVQCALHSQDYSGVIEACCSALKCDRHAKGFYTYKAQAQLALGNMEKGIQSMKMALIYETPWDEKNRQNVMDFYNELIEKQSLKRVST